MLGGLYPTQSRREVSGHSGASFVKVWIIQAFDKDIERYLPDFFFDRSDFSEIFSLALSVELQLNS